MKLFRSACTLVVICSTIAFVQAAHAHHSAAGFDLSKHITVTGAVTRIDWGNPHVYVFIEQVVDGRKIEWEVECFPPTVLRRTGWDKTKVKVGDVLVVTGNPAKDDGHRDLFPSSITRGGEALFSMQNTTKIYTQNVTPKSDSAPHGLAGTWATVANMPAIQRAMTHEASTLTKEGVEALKRFDQTLSPSVSCIASQAPLPMLFPDHKQVTVGADAVTIEGEFEYGRRTIHLDTNNHDGAIPSLQGHSIGRWEGKALVIDTAQFAFHGTGNGGRLPSSAQKHLIERIVPSDDGRTVTYSFEIIDPVYLATPKKGSIEWAFAPTAKFEADPCRLDSARRYMK